LPYIKITILTKFIAFKGSVKMHYIIDRLIRKGGCF
jgi:hypothetical protein